MAYHSLKEIIDYCDKKKVSFFQAVLDDDMEERKVSKEESMAQMYAMWDAMLLASTTYDGSLISASGLTGRQGAQMEEYRKSGKTLCGDFISQVVVQALEMGESNACMKRIVAAPTAGSCGVVPAVLISLQEERGYTEEQMTEALYVTAGIGGVIASRAFLSGAAGGCQAEIGSASAMAAGGAVYLLGGDAGQIANAAALALKNLLGLACDPVAGLVEVPCVKRNVMGAVNAMTSADLTMAGIMSRVPPDEVIDAMRSIGRCMHEDLRETGKGGLAGTPTGVKIRDRMSGMQDPG